MARNDLVITELIMLPLLAMIGSFAVSKSEAFQPDSHTLQYHYGIESIPPNGFRPHTSFLVLRDCSGRSGEKIERLISKINPILQKRHITLMMRLKSHTSHFDSLL